MPSRRPRESRPPADVALSGFVELWRDLFTTRVHLDSALAKRRGPERARLASIVPALLRQPRALAGQVGVRLAAGEPWILQGSQLAEWPQAAQIAARLGDEIDVPALMNGLRTSRDDYPPGMVSELDADWGRTTTDRLVAELSRSPRLSLRGAKKMDRERLCNELEAATGSRPAPGLLAPHALYYEGYVPVLNTESHQRGEFEIQDEGSQLMAWFALDPAAVAPLLCDVPGQESSGHAGPVARFPALTVIDACAGAGGKTLAIADLLAGKGRVYAYDVSEIKLRALRRRASRAGVRNIQSVAVPEAEADADRVLTRFHGTADVVLVDAPCTGWGVLRRNPDIKWRQTEDERTRLPKVQLSLLTLYGQLVKPGGRLVYGACTFRKSETLDIRAQFLSSHPEYRAGPGGFVGPGASDGFYMQSFDREVRRK